MYELQKWNPLNINQNIFIRNKYFINYIYYITYSIECRYYQIFKTPMPTLKFFQFIIFQFQTLYRRSENRIKLKRI